MSYFAISANANVDNSQGPGSQVVYGQPELFLPTITDGRNGKIDEGRGRFGHVTVMSVQEIPETGLFQSNGLAVTENSARPDIGIPFLGTSAVLANHAVLSSAPTANIVISYIRLSHTLKLPEE